MFSFIEGQIRYLSSLCYSGSVKFGVESGEVKAYFLSSKRNESVMATPEEVKKTLLKLYPEESDFYGSLEYYFNFGKVVGCMFSISLQGDQLKKFIMGTRKCRHVNNAEKV